LNLQAVLFVAQVVSAHANDATPFRQGVMSVSLKQGGHELAPDEVARAAKKNEVKSHFVLELHKNLILNVTLFH